MGQTELSVKVSRHEFFLSRQWQEWDQQKREREKGKRFGTYKSIKQTKKELKPLNPIINSKNKSILKPKNSIE